MALNDPTSEQLSLCVEGVFYLNDTARLSGYEEVILEDGEIAQVQRKAKVPADLARETADLIASGKTVKVQLDRQRII